MTIPEVPMMTTQALSPDDAARWDAISKRVQDIIYAPVGPSEIESDLVWLARRFLISPHAPPSDCGGKDAEPDPTRACNVIEAALRSYTCTFHRCGEDHSESGLPLVDVLSTGYPTIKQGGKELALLAEHLYDNLPPFQVAYFPPPARFSESNPAGLAAPLAENNEDAGPLSLAPSGPVGLDLSRDVADYQRVMAWARDPERRPALSAFTAGAERQAAYWIENTETLLGRQLNAPDVQPGCNGTKET